MKHLSQLEQELPEVANRARAREESLMCIVDVSHRSAMSLDGVEYPFWFHPQGALPSDHCFASNSGCDAGTATPTGQASSGSEGGKKSLPATGAIAGTSEDFAAPRGNPSSLEPSTLDATTDQPGLRLVSRASAEESGKRTWCNPNSSSQLTPGQKEWLVKLDKKDLFGMSTPISSFANLQGDVLTANSRITEKYKDECLETCGLGKMLDLEWYGHLSSGDVELLRWVVRRGYSAVWLPDSPRTSSRGFKHRLITRGPSVRVPLCRLSREATEWCEVAIQEDAARGQLRKGNSSWGGPAFQTQEAPEHKAIKRSRRLVVDYRALNRVTVRKVFLIPDSDQVKATVAGNKYISVSDLKEGLNQCDNEPETSKKMPVLVASGTYRPKGLTFDPTNGPEDFQELVFLVFARRLYKEWFLFFDDLAVATGRPPPLPPGPSGAHDVVTVLDEVEPDDVPRSLKFDKEYSSDITGDGPGVDCWGCLEAPDLWRRFSVALRDVISLQIQKLSSEMLLFEISGKCKAAVGLSPWSSAQSDARGSLWQPLGSSVSDLG